MKQAEVLDWSFDEEDWSFDEKAKPNSLARKGVTIKQLMENPPPAPEDLIEGVLGVGEIVNLSGQWKVGKTWFALAMALSLTDVRRSNFLGHALKKHGPIVYLDTENGPSLMYERAKCLGVDGYGYDFHYFSLRPGEIRLDSKDSSKELLDVVQGIQPVLVVFDSLLRFFEQDENSAQGINKLFEGLAPLREIGTSVVLLDHQARGRNNGPRGSGDKQAFVDRIWTLGKTDSEAIHSGATWCHLATRRGVPPPDEKLVLKTALDGTLHLEVEGAEDSKGLSADAQLMLRHLCEHPRTNKGALGSLLFSGNRTRCDKAMQELQRGQYADYEEGPKRAQLWFCTPKGEAAVTAVADPEFSVCP